MKRKIYEDFFISVGDFKLSSNLVLPLDSSSTHTHGSLFFHQREENIILLSASFAIEVEKWKEKREKKKSFMRS
jgi:hypothetical protein